MIYTSDDNRYLEYTTPLIEYITSKYLYNNENLIYTNKYSNGTFSITNPTSEFSNCCLINGYPHFDIPLDKCLEEIYFFLNNKSMYKNHFYIRYGDTHPHKCIPKLAQVRNLLIENSLSCMIGKSVTSFYGIGDISIKSLDDFIKRNNFVYDSEDLFINLLNNTLSSDILHQFNLYNLNALEEISVFLKKLRLMPKNFLFESQLYKDRTLYNEIKSNPKYTSELKENGELKYSLQELMFIKTILKNPNDILINIIGANQIAHVLKVDELLKGSRYNNRFLTYEICRNADDRNIEHWSALLNNYIAYNNLEIDYQNLLKILILINSNDIIIDFNNLKKYYNNIDKFESIIQNILKKNDYTNVTGKNDLICKMALVGYNLNRSIEMGNPNHFYKYLLSVVKEYEVNPEAYHSIEGLYKQFVMNCLYRLGYDDNNLIRELKK